MKHLEFWRSAGVASFFILSLLFLPSCEEREDIGLQLQDEESLLDVSVADLDIVSQTIIADSVLTSGVLTAQLGDLMDPTFGRTQVSIYTGVRLSALSPDFSEIQGIDSLVLVMQYEEEQEPYGAEELMEFSVIRLTEALTTDTSYYSTSTAPDDGIELLHPSESPFVPDHESEVFIGTDTTGVPAQIRLRLTDDFAQALVDEANAEASAFDDLEEFRLFFQGLVIRASNLGAQGAIYSLDLLDSDSELVLYYRDMDGDAEAFRFTINSVTPRFSSFTHDYSGTPVQTALDMPDVTTMENYIQATAGLSVKIDVQSLLTFEDTAQAIINKAEIILPIEPSVNMDNTPSPERIFALHYDEDSVLVSVPDIFEGDAHYGGFDDNGIYRINITRFSQRLINGEISIPELFIIPTGSATTANFVKVNGVDSAEPLRLEVVFTRY